MINTWIPCTDELPPDGEIVMTKIDDGKGLRNEQKLQLRGACGGPVIWRCMSTTRRRTGNELKIERGGIEAPLLERK
jgi:hypothetical protein